MNNAAINPLYRTLGAFTPPVQPTPIKEVQRRAIDAKQEEVRAAYERIEHLELMLEECRDWFENRSDVIDGDHGFPRPNAEMRMLQSIDGVL